MIRAAFAIVAIVVVVLPVLVLPAEAQQDSVSGVMRHSTLEGGGCWVLAGRDGKSYELRGDSETMSMLQHDGAIVDLTVEPIKNAMSACMVGEIVRVTQIRNIRMQPIDLPVMPATIDGTLHRTTVGHWYVVTKQGSKFQFEEPPAKKLRKNGAHYHAHVMLLSSNSRTEAGMDGLILKPPHTKKAGKKSIP